MEHVVSDITKTIPDEPIWHYRDPFRSLKSHRNFRSLVGQVLRKVYAVANNRLPISTISPAVGSSTPGMNFGFARGEFQSWDFALNVAVFNVLVNASSSPELSFF